MGVRAMASKAQACSAARRDRFTPVPECCPISLQS